eukprot:TRINITY_DN2177_c0_g1_i1.p1 TRINITY_DN2177_c0_g1~~TRINITY_DN2177_c0_g1_i1.p1  ORF type:complete len:145 (+),score=16.46 TRINITY_DN2177_c0_g1_i1:499-933(+)
MSSSVREYPPRPYNPYDAYQQRGYPGYPASTSVPGFYSSAERGTLYVTNLPRDVTERELSILFRFMPNFSKMRLVVREGKAPICFVDFLDGPSAYLAMQTLQGFRMDLRDTSLPGLVVEFDKDTRSKDPSRSSGSSLRSSSGLL